MIEYEILIRIIISAVVGFAIGYSRKHKAAGLRTFSLICLGCTAFTVASAGNYLPLDADASGILGHIISGIGFLGLGVIWHHKGKPIGLTTAATIWVTAAIGIMIGIGAWTEALVTTSLALAIVFYPEHEK